MNTNKIGFAISIIVLIGTALITFWPVIATSRFLISAGFTGGIIGMLVFGIAMQSKEIDEE